MTEQLEAVKLAEEESIVLYRSHLGELPAILLLIVSFVAMFFLSMQYPESIQRIPIQINPDLSFNLVIPLFGIIPIVIMGYLTHALCNFRYTIGPDFISETEGLVSSKKVDRRIEFDFIRGVEIERTLFGRIVNVGNLKIGSAMSSEIEICFQGIRDPSLWRDVVLLKMRKLELSQAKAFAAVRQKSTTE